MAEEIADLDIGYLGPRVTCPGCGSQEVEFLGNEGPKSWFKCRICGFDRALFSLVLQKQPIFSYRGGRT